MREEKKSFSPPALYQGRGEEGLGTRLMSLTVQVETLYLITSIGSVTAKLVIFWAYYLTTTDSYPIFPPKFSLFSTSTHTNNQELIWSYLCMHPWVASNQFLLPYVSLCTSHFLILSSKIEGTQSLCGTIVNNLTTGILFLTKKFLYLHEDNLEESDTLELAS